MDDQRRTAMVGPIALAMAAMAWADDRGAPNVLRIDPEDDFDIVPDHPNKGKKRPPLVEAKPREPSPEDISREERAAAKRARKNAKRLRDAGRSPK